MKDYCLKRLVVLMVFFAACTGDEDPVIVEEEKNRTVTYTESMDDFPNPERGFYRYSETRGSNYSSLTPAQLKDYRNPKTSSGAQYQTVVTLVFRYYVLDVFKDKELSQDFLNLTKKDFEAARAGGVKLIPRFTYTLSAKSGDCPEQSICPPYGDAPKDIVLGHIEQLKPIFQENSDVLAALQMGFIGIWGENYYTDYFGDASSSGQGKLLDPNWQDRFEVLRALLDATPKDVMIQVRYPQIKQRFVYGINALTSSAALTEGEAFSEEDKARLGHHNDCFLASADDFGTYQDYGNSSSPRSVANTALRAYLRSDSKFVVIGGETCSDGYSPENDCDPAGRAEKEFADYHFTFLNADYNNQVNNDWVTGGCMDNIRRKLGYRIVLREGTYPKEVKTGGTLDISIELDNIGYASPYRERSVLLVLRNKTSNAIHKITFDTDLRRWYTGSHTLTGSFELPADVVAGEYDLFLSLPDKHDSIKDRFEYAIRLANTEMWEEASGLNSLNHTLSVK
jgi:hypothetical protein